MADDTPFGFQPSDFKTWREYIEAVLEEIEHQSRNVERRRRHEQSLQEESRKYEVNPIGYMLEYLEMTKHARDPEVRLLRKRVKRKIRVLRREPRTSHDLDRDDSLNLAFLFLVLAFIVGWPMSAFSAWHRPWWVGIPVAPSLILVSWMLRSRGAYAWLWFPAVSCLCLTALSSFFCIVGPRPTKSCGVIPEMFALVAGILLVTAARKPPKVEAL